MCLTHTLSDVSSVFFDHTAPGIESQDRRVERQNMQSFWEIYGKHIQSSGCDYLYQKQPLISLNCMWSSIVLEFCLLFHFFVFGFGLKPSKSTCQGKPLDTLSPWISRCQDTSRPGNLLETWMVWMKVEMAWKACERPFCASKKVWRQCLPVFLPCLFGMIQELQAVSTAPRRICRERCPAGRCRPQSQKDTNPVGDILSNYNFLQRFCLLSSN